MSDPLRAPDTPFAPRVIEADNEMAPLRPLRPQVIVTEQTDPITPSDRAVVPSTPPSRYAAATASSLSASPASPYSSSGG